MATFNPALIQPISKSVEFAQSDAKRSAKTILLDGIDKQIAMFKDPKTEGRRWFVVGKEECAIALKVNNKPLPLMGDETKVVVPLAHVEDAFAFYKSEIQAGKFDKALAEADKGIEARRAKMAATRKANAAKKP